MSSSNRDSATLLHAAELLEEWADDIDLSGGGDTADLLATARRLREMAEPDRLPTYEWVRPNPDQRGSGD